VVPVGADGKIRLANRSSGTVQLIADIAGYYLSGAVTVPGGFASLRPARVLDTRIALGAAGPVPASSSIAVQILGRGGVPAAGVSAVVVNLTVTAPARAGALTAYADGTSMPTTSNLNFVAGQTIPNLAVVPVGADGKIRLANRSSGTVQLIADIAGYYLVAA